MSVGGGEASVHSAARTYQAHSGASAPQGIPSPTTADIAKVCSNICMYESIYIH